MIIKGFTEPELEYFRQTCNFVGYEKDVFEMRSRGVPLEAIAETLGYTSDGIKGVSRRVNNKIIKVSENRP